MTKGSIQIDSDAAGSRRQMRVPLLARQMGRINSIQCPAAPDLSKPIGELGWGS